MHRFARAAAVPLLLSGLAACAGADMAPFGRTTAGVQEDSPTIRRVRGLEPDTAPLAYEPGTVWPAPSADPPRTLFPEEPPARSAPPPGSPRSEAPQPPPAARELTARAALPAPPPERVPALRPGTVLADGVVVTGGGAGGIATTLSPAGSGLALREGASVVLIGPDGAVRHVPVPPG